MMLIGRIAKEPGPWWSAECDLVGAFTQGRSRKDARAMLADCIETKINRAGFKVSVTELAADGKDGYSVFIDAEPLTLLTAEVLKYQRAKHRLSLSDVAKKLGASSRNAYASYERGRTEPSISKLRQLLAVVAPEMTLVIGPRPRSHPTTKR